MRWPLRLYGYTCHGSSFEFSDDTISPAVRLTYKECLYPMNCNSTGG